MTKRGRFDSKSAENPFAVCPYVRDNSEIEVSMKNQKINSSGKENTPTAIFNDLRFSFFYCSVQISGRRSNTKEAFCF